MRVVVIYKKDTDYERTVLDFLRDFEYQTGHILETMDPESTDGYRFCEAYDIVEYPSIVVVSDDSRLQNMWKGMPLPTISEVSYYAGQN
jgi:hypothetical protein